MPSDAARAQAAQDERDRLAVERAEQDQERRLIDDGLLPKPHGDETAMWSAMSPFEYDNTLARTLFDALCSADRIRQWTENERQQQQHSLVAAMRQAAHRRQALIWLADTLDESLDPDGVAMRVIRHAIGDEA